MLQEEGLYVLTSGRQWSQVRQQNGRAVSISYALGPEARLRKTALPPETRGTLMGICDQDFSPGRSDVDGFVRDVLYETQRLGYTGVLADWEGICQTRVAFLQRLEQALEEKQLPLFAPRPYGPHLSTARLVTPCCVSGGSLEEMLREQIDAFGAQRLAMDLTPMCQAFTLPCHYAHGRTLTPEQCRALLKQYGSSLFFSREMCVKYFTFMDENKQGNYVLFDDASTLQRKMQLCRSLGITTFFLVYADYLALT